MQFTLRHKNFQGILKALKNVSLCISFYYVLNYFVTNGFCRYPSHGQDEYSCEKWCRNPPPNLPNERKGLVFCVTIWFALLIPMVEKVILAQENGFQFSALAVGGQSSLLWKGYYRKYLPVIPCWVTTVCHWCPPSFYTVKGKLRLLILLH